MKKFLVLLFVFLFSFNVYAQLAVVDGVVDTLLTASNLQQFIYFGQQVKHNAEAIMQAVLTVQNLEHQVKMTMQNLASVKDIESWSDFINWYNRQLYMERKTIQTFENMNVKIGKETYHLTDIEGILYSINDQGTAYWEGEFTPEQKRAMWYDLGLTPSNYAFVQPFRAKARQIAMEGLTARDIQNEWYMRNLARSNERQSRRARDKYADDDNKMGQKEVLIDIAESLDESNKVLNDIAMQNAQMLEAQAVNHYLKQTPHSNPGFSEWPDDGFQQLKFDKH